MSTSDATLRVVSSSEMTELAIVDGRQNTAATGLGTLEEKLPAGIYKVRARRGPARYEELVALNADRTITIDDDRLRFPTPLPLDGTTRSHPYQQLAAATASLMEPTVVGSGARLFVFARGWTPDESYRTDPLAGVSLLKVNGEPLGIEASMRRTAPDTYAALTLEVDPGAYRIRLIDARGAARERVLIAAAGWQTQLFLLAGSSADPRVDLDRGAVAMSPPREGFDPTSGKIGHERLRGEYTAALARYALTQNRPLARATYQELLKLKFDDPILGLLCAHLLLRDMPENVTLRDEVVGNMRRLLGADHPDVQALDLYGSAAPKEMTLTAPPMLRSSWNLLTAASLSRPELIPSGDLFGLIQDTIQPSAPWLVWRPPEGTLAVDVDAQTHEKLDALRQFVQGYRKASKTVLASPRPEPPLPHTNRLLRYFVSPQIFDDIGPGAPLPLDSAARLTLTKSLGVSGARLDEMLKAVDDEPLS